MDSGHWALAIARLFIEAFASAIAAEFPTIEETARLKQEYQILRDLPLEGVIEAYEYREQYQKD